MLDFSLAALTEAFDENQRRQSYALYVVDSNLRIALFGTSLSDLAPAAVTQTLPREVASTLAVTLYDHSFEREPIARIATRAGRRVRAARIESVDTPFYAVMVENQDGLAS